MSPVKPSYWLKQLELQCAALHVLSCWPVIRLQASGHLLLALESNWQEWNGLKFPSPGKFHFKSSSSCQIYE